ncbi:hypothetical protein BH11PSE3_BH11PSE3_28550 [soil metagenome]
MSTSIKFLIFAIALVFATGGYLVMTHLKLAPRRVAATSAPAPAAVPVPTSTATTTNAGSTQSAAGTSVDPALAKVYGECVSGAFPTQADAAARAAACSTALQSRQLKPDEIAAARLVRGIARTALGDKELASEDYVDAVQRYDRLINPGNADALNLFRRAAALDAIGQTDKALDDYNEAIKSDPKASLAFLGRGVLLAVRKRAYDRAIADFDRVLELEPDNVDGLIARGDAFSQLGNPGRAMVDLNRAVTLAPTRAIAYVARGQAENRRGNITEAAQNYEQALIHDPRQVAALVSLAAIQSITGRYEAAIGNLDKAIAVDARNPVAFYNRGYAHYALKHYDKAIADYSSAIELDPKMGLAYNNRGLTRAIAGKDLTEALGDTDQALKLLPLNLDVCETRGFIFLKLGDPALALVPYNSALDIDPNRALALYGRGLAKIRMGDTAAGRNDQAAALTLNPDVAADFSRYGLE